MNNTLGLNQTFPIYNADGTAFHGLELKKSTSDSVVMSLGDNITGDVYYKDNTLNVTMNEYIKYNGVKYVLVNPPTIVREGMVKDNGELKGMTKYSFTFYHPMYQLSNMPLCDVAVSSDQQRYLSENKVFGWAGYPDDYIAKLNKNLDGTEWIVEKSNRFPALKDNVLSEVLSFENNTIADALKKFYDTWKVPYVVDVVSSGETSYAQGKRFKVVIGLPSNEIYASESDRQLMQPYVFRMGHGVGLKNNSRTPRNNKIITRISGYGSENNIPYGYPQIVWDGAEDDPRLEYPLYDGIVGGRYVKLIKHPFTRKYLMPSIYSETVNKKVNPNAVGYDPTIELKDYYDAIRTEEYPYVNEINPLAPSYESHQFDVKPEMDDGQSNVEILNAIPLNADLTPAASWDDTMDGDGNYIQSYFQITLPVLSFDLYACAAITQEMQINMRGGACIGCTFPIQVDWEDYKANFYDQNGNFAPDGEQRNLAKYPKSNLGSISVVVQKEYQTFGTIMPNVFQQPKNGDKFVVLGISLPSEYISNAEKRLDGEMKSYMLENNVHYYDYPLKFDEYFLATHTYILEQLKPNSVVRFDFAGYELQLFVKQLTIKYGQDVLPQYDITLTDNIEVVLNQIGQVSDDVERLSSVISMMREGYSRNVWTELAKKLSKTSDDTARGKITFLKGLEAVGSVLIRGALTAWEAVMNRVRSENYTDDTGWELTNDNGAGSSQLTVDYIRARRKLIAESIEVKERHASAGDVILTEATAEISRVDYLDSEGNQLGVHSQKVPFTLNGVLLMLQKVMGTSRLEPRGIASDSRTVRGALSAAERQRIARVRSYFLASDGERDVENWWAVGDLAYCMTQNLTRTPRDSRIGAPEKAGNVFWWRQVIGIDADGAVTLEDGKEYHYIDFSVNYAEEQAGTYSNSAYLSDLPAPGDKCMQFGNVSNSDRMNAIMVEVNGVGNVNAPDIVFYRGIYTYSLDRCWWGGESCRKAKLSPSTGWEFTGPDFKFITEYGQARVPVDRGAWLSIPEERDVREPHENVRKCYYFDRVTHLGSLWLCINADDYIWLKNEGTAESPVWNYWGTSDPRTQPDYSDDLYRRVLDYTTVEPSENAPTVWQKQVAKGEKGDAGTSPWVADLDNEMDSVACDAAGHPTSEQTVMTGVSLFFGATAKGFTLAVKRNGTAYAESGAAIDNVTASWNNSTGAVSIVYATEATISDKDNFEITVTAMDDSSVVRVLNFTVNGMRPGPDGKPATIYNLLPSQKQISVGRNADGTYNPATFTLRCGYVKNVGGEMTTVNDAESTFDGWNVFFRFRGRGASWSVYWCYHAGTNKSQYLTNVAVANVDAVEFVICNGSQGATYQTLDRLKVIDRETVPVVADGANGTSGRNSSVITIYKRSANNPDVAQGGADRPTATLYWNYSNVLYADADCTTAATSQLNGWSLNIPAGTDPCWARQVAVSGTGTATISISDWSSAVRCYKDGKAGADGYSFFVTPASLIVNQSLTDTSDFGLPKSFTFSVMKGETACRFKLAVGLSPADFTLAYDSQTAATSHTLTLTAISGTITSGRIDVTLTVTDPDGGGTFTKDMRVEVYVNRLGTWKQTIENGMETIVAEKISYVLNDEDDSLTIDESKDTFNSVRNATVSLLTWQRDYKSVYDGYAISIRDINTWRQSANETISTLSNTVDGHTESISEIRQTAKEISMSVTSGYRNYITNPLGVQGTVNQASASSDVTDDATFVPCKRIQYTPSVTSDYSLLFGMSSEYTRLTRGYVTYFVICKRISTNSRDQFLFGPYKSSGTIYYDGIKVTVPDGELTLDSHENDSQYNNGERNYGIEEIGNGWYRCWFSFLATEAVWDGSSQCGINNVYGTWYFYAVGIVSGKGCPSVASIVANTGIRRTGIDIEDGKINLYGDRVTFSNSTGTVSGKVWIDPDDGTIHATDGEFSGKVTATDGEIGGFYIGEDRLYNTNYGAGIAITNSATNPSKAVLIGDEAEDTMTGYKCGMSATCKDGSTYNTALFLDAQGGSYNYAFHGNGNGVLNGLVFGFKTQYIAVGGSTRTYFDIGLKNGSTIIFTGYRSAEYALVRLPTLYEVRNCLGLVGDKSTPFAIELNIINKARGASADYLHLVFRGYSTQTASVNYPYLMSDDDTYYEGGAAFIQLGQGDIVKLMLMWVPSGVDSYGYRAYPLIQRG